MSDKLTREQIEETRKMVHEWVEAGLWDASRLLEFDPIFDAALAHLEAHRAEASKDGEGERVGYAEALDMAYIECFACSCDRCPLTHPCQDLNRWMPDAADAAQTSKRKELADKLRELAGTNPLEEAKP